MELAAACGAGERSLRLMSVSSRWHIGKAVLACIGIAELGGAWRWQSWGLSCGTTWGRRQAPADEGFGGRVLCTWACHGGDGDGMGLPGVRRSCLMCTFYAPLHPVGLLLVRCCRSPPLRDWGAAPLLYSRAAE